ncbi:hypothetical protein GXM_06738 [Nostoc sphaeroides CCNUC1]|uniref:Uncharacterized protein n=1 Tax=Nostoc sphaeroides CCNUC1 TaxID=2653204 RepID=A0A5P8W9B0_9NOSO|nr:hypothetical protein GXM_06738 [Nostoc sphaeroides CCNUC1]
MTGSIERTSLAARQSMLLYRHWYKQFFFFTSGLSINN